MKKYSIEDFANSKIAVKVYSTEELDRLLDRATSEYCVVTSIDARFDPPYVYVLVNNYGYAKTYSEEHRRWFSVPIVELVDVNGLEKFEIKIWTYGRDTYADLIKDGKIVKREKARCHPDDEQSFRTGATVAFERLWRKKKPLRKSNYDRAYHDALVSLSALFETIEGMKKEKWHVRNDTK